MRSLSIRKGSEMHDVGRRFLTNVPDAPFQIIGVRHPWSGKLHPRGRVLDPDRINRLTRSKDIEIVTGEEGERLILALIDTVIACRAPSIGFRT
jgi:hypothetical protein